MFSAHNDLVPHVEFNQLLNAVETSDEKKSKYSEYFTHWEVVRQMASMLNFSDDSIKILDPKAGNGSLFLHSLTEFLVRRLDQIRLVFLLMSLTGNY